MELSSSDLNTAVSQALKDEFNERYERGERIPIMKGHRLVIVQKGHEDEFVKNIYPVKLNIEDMLRQKNERDTG